MNLRVGVFILSLCCVVTTAAACLWDSDSLAMEAEGAPGVLEAIVGRFDRFPPVYYERRIEIAEGRLADDPSQLAACDDIGVAHDRLGNPDAAIETMSRKRAVLDASPDSEHEYRYLANLGTFHMHRWLKNGADRSAMGDVEAAELIDAAIELNPDAHFGRERYQLLAIRWVLEAPFTEAHLSSGPSGYPVLFDADSEFLEKPRLYVGYPEPMFAEDGKYNDALKGLTGLMSLGAAWESVDVVFALCRVLMSRGDSSLAGIAATHLMTLLEDGRRSLSAAWVPDGAAYFQSIDEQSIFVNFATGTEGMANDPHDLMAWYEAARAEAAAWRSARNGYITTKIQAGEHPDTHGQFWDAWEEPHAMPALLTKRRLSHEEIRAIAYIVVFGTLVACVGGIGYLIWRTRRDKQTPAASS